MSLNYISGRIIIETKQDGSFNNITENINDYNYEILKNLYEANESRDLDTYKRLFDEFVNNDKLCGWFSYTDEPQCSHVRNFYSLCSCNISEDNLNKVHRGLYESKCNCQNGKRYIALRNAYEIAFKQAMGTKYCMITSLISDFTNECDQQVFLNDPIIKWIETTGPVDKTYTEFTYTEFTHTEFTHTEFTHTEFTN
jgi:hypothetical protein